MEFKLIFLLGILSFLSCGRCDRIYKESQLLNDAIHVDARRIPMGGMNGTDENAPVMVRVNMYLRTIDKIDDINMDYSVQISLRQMWINNRTRYEDASLKYLRTSDPRLIWTPDLFFTNEKQGHIHHLIRPNAFLRFFPDGNILYSLRVSVTLSCPMNFALFPFDTQICSIKMGSYGLTTEDLVFMWKEDDPVQIVKNLNIPQFTVNKFSTSYCNSKTNTGNYSCLKVDLHLKRQSSYYFLQVYVPCCMMIIISWFSFWLDPKALIARIAISLTTLMVTVLQLSCLNASLPHLSYTRAIDVWTGVCLTFIFGTLLEIIVVDYISRSKWDNNWQHSRRGSKNTSDKEITSDIIDKDNDTSLAMKTLDDVQQDNESTKSEQSNFFLSWVCKFQTLSQKIDAVSRIVFPFGFIFFNLVYWITYL